MSLTNNTMDEQTHKTRKISQMVPKQTVDDGTCRKGGSKSVGRVSRPRNPQKERRRTGSTSPRGVSVLKCSSWCALAVAKRSSLARQPGDAMDLAAQNKHKQTVDEVGICTVHFLFGIVAGGGAHVHGHYVHPRWRGQVSPLLVIVEACHSFCVSAAA